MQALTKSTNDSLEALASGLQTGITINTASTVQSQQANASHTQSYMFGPGSAPMGNTPLLPPSSNLTYASVLAKGALSPSRRRRQSMESSDGDSTTGLSELMAKQQVCSYSVCESQSSKVEFYRKSLNMIELARLVCCCGILLVKTFSRGQTFLMSWSMIYVTQGVSWLGIIFLNN